MKITIQILLVAIIIFSVYCCKSDPNKNVDQKKSDVENISGQDNTPETSEYDTIRLNYSEHADILTALTQVPDSSMRSWKWTKNERQQFVKSFQKDGFFVDTNPNYNDIIEITPNSLKTRVVDGSWVLTVYRMDQKNKIIITNDIVSGGNDIMAFRSHQNELVTTDFNDLIPEFYEAFVSQKDSSCAKQVLGSNYFALGDYEFKNDGLEVELWQNDDYEHCIKSLSKFFKFKPENGLFELENK